MESQTHANEARLRSCVGPGDLAPLSRPYQRGILGVQARIQDSTTGGGQGPIFDDGGAKAPNLKIPPKSGPQIVQIGASDFPASNGGWGTKTE